jgi:protein subunit release factor A
MKHYTQKASGRGGQARTTDSAVSVTQAKLPVGNDTSAIERNLFGREP